MKPCRPVLARASSPARRRTPSLSPLLLAAALPWQAPAEPTPDVMLQAMEIEIERSMDLQLEDLEKIENPEEYYCLEEIWDWDDETESEYAPDCEPYTEGAELKTSFSASHEYRYPGSYTVHLRLMRNGKTILAGNTRVEIRS